MDLLLDMFEARGGKALNDLPSLCKVKVTRSKRIYIDQTLFVMYITGNVFTETRRCVENSHSERSIARVLVSSR